jgi:light-regulated signal transduction histidine kinase (bacteriophytochrome)
MLDERNTGTLDERSRELMGHTVDGAKRMQTLIGDLLAYSRVGSKGISKTHIDGREIVNKAMRQLSVAIAESGAVIKVDSLPAMWADPVQITQLFQNLIGNAIKFRGKIQPDIHVSAEQVNGETIFSVRDNGIGIAPEYHKKIFGIFQRLLSRRDYPGTGIGLAICKKIVKRHGGRIWVESRASEGANFRFTLSESITK